MGATWHGALEIKVSGIPVPVNVALFPRMKASRGESFKTLGEDGKPVRQFYEDSTGQKTAVTYKGVAKPGTKGKSTVWVKLDDEAVERIQSGEKSTFLTPDSFAPLSTIDLSLSTMSYNVVPDANVPGAESSCQVLWNGLWANHLAYVTRATFRAGATDKIIVLYATDTALMAIALPFQEELYEPPTFAYEQSDQIGKLFGQAVEQEYEVKRFDLADHASQYKAHRLSVIEQVLAGAPVDEVAESAPQAQAPDLLGLLTASIADQPKATKPVLAVAA